MKLIKRVKNGAFLYQTTLVPRAPRISRTLCRHATFSKVAWWLSHSRWLIKTFLVLSVQFLLYITFDSNYSHFLNVKSAASKFFEKRENFQVAFFHFVFIKVLYQFIFQLSTTMYNFCVVLARWGIFVKNDKCLVWNSLVGRILILKRPRPLRLSPSG